MANRRPQAGGSGGRRMDFQRNDNRNKNFGRAGVSPWQGGGPGAGLPQLLPLGGGSTEATLALASNLLNLLQPRPNPVPSLLDMPIRRDFVPNMGRFDRGFVPQRMGNQGNFRRTGNYNRAGERINNNRKPFKPNDGPRQYNNKSSPKKEADSKAKPVKESETAETTTEEAPTVEVKVEKKEPPKTRYDDISPQLLKCHICNKSMWDGRSFENHLSGRAHAIMMQKTAESYALTADTMRQEFKIREMKRTRKSGQQAPRDFYCAMCDMYAGDGGVHRTTVGHRKLKKYLHPTCTSCHKEMPTRIELDEHRLTAEHLKNMQDKQEDVTKPKPEVMMISTLCMEQSFLRDDKQRKRRGDRDRTSASDANINAADNVEDGIKKEPGTEPEGQQTKTPIDKEDTVLDYQEGDDLSHVTADMIPAYSTERGVGASFLAEYRCVQCKLCNKLLDSPDTAQVHLRTWKHHQLFVRSLQPQQQREQEPVAESVASAKRPMDCEDDGNWKRRRANTDNEDDDIDNGQDVDNGHDTAVKEEPHDQDQETDQNAGNQLEQDAEMPSQEELEDWEQSVDEILHDEKGNDPEPASNAPQNNGAEFLTEAFFTEIDSALAESEAEAPAPVPPVSEAPAPAPVPAPPISTNTPRATARRGRGRGRGRY